MKGSEAALRLFRLRLPLSVDLESRRLVKRVGLALVAPIVMALLVSLGSFFALRKALLEEIRVTNESERVFILVEKLHGESEHLIGAIRGALLSGDPMFHAEYELAEKNVRDHLSAVGASLSSRELEGSRAKLADVGGAVLEYLEVSAAALRERRGTGLPEARYLDLLSASVRPKREALQAVLDSFRSGVERALRERQEQSARTLNRSLAAILTFTTVALGALAYLALLAARAFVALTERAQIAVAQKSASVEMLKRTNGELETVTRDLKRSEQRLLQLNEELERFTSIAAHDLREPLRTIASYLKLLGTRYEGKLDRDAGEFIQLTLEAAARGRALVDDLLEYAHAGSHGRETTPVDGNAVVDQALGNLRALIEEKKAVVTRETLPTVRGHEGALIQVFQNLVGNGLKYNRSVPPQIAIRCQRDADQWLFSVRDNGIGIKEEAQRRIFEPFQRLHGRTEYLGTGLGLAVCRKIVDLHGGRIWVVSTPGHGATFYLSLPAEPGLFPAPPAGRGYRSSGATASGPSAVENDPGSGRGSPRT